MATAAADWEELGDGEDLEVAQKRSPAEPSGDPQTYSRNAAEPERFSTPIAPNRGFDTLGTCSLMASPHRRPPSSQPQVQQSKPKSPAAKHANTFHPAVQALASHLPRNLCQPLPKGRDAEFMERLRGLAQEACRNRAGVSVVRSGVEL